MMHSVALFVATAFLRGVPPGQPSPASEDGKITVAYSELQNLSDVSLSLKLRPAVGQAAPAGMLLTFHWRFEGKLPTVPPSEIEIRAYAGLLWAPRAELEFQLDNEKTIRLPSRAVLGFGNEGGSGFYAATVKLDVVRQIAGANRIEGSALGMRFELDEGQHRALRDFVDYALAVSVPGRSRRDGRVGPANHAQPTSSAGGGNWSWSVRERRCSVG
jgi:hypothetical protein